MNSDKLIFIVSQPRSGSTLLQSILSNNDYINTVSEPWLLLPFLNIFDSSLIEAKYNQQLAVAGIFDFANKVGGEDVLIEKLRDFLLSVYRPLSIGNVKYILDKTPRYYEILPIIQKVFPDAKIILLKRNPFAVLNSIIDTWGDTNTIADLYPFKRDILYAPFLIQTFLEKNRSDDQHVREVIYEDLVQNPEEEVKALFEWLNISYDSSVLDYSRNDRYRGLMGDKAGNKERDKPTDEDVDKWQKKFTDSYWSDFFKGYAAFSGKDFLSSYGNYSTGFSGKDIHETPQFRKFKYFSEDRLFDINFVDAIKDYERYDLAIKQQKNQEKQLEYNRNLLNLQMEQLEQQKEQLKQQKEQNNLQKAYEVSEADRATKLEVINNLQRKYEESEADRAARLEVIKELQKKYEESEVDRAERLEVIDNLQRKYEESEVDCAESLEVVKRQEKEFAENMEKLQRKYEESEVDRAARLEVIKELQRKYEEYEVNRVARLEVIKQQEKEFAENMGKLQRKYEESEVDRAERLEVVKRQEKEFAENMGKLQRKYEESEVDRAARLEVIKELQNKIQNLLSPKGIIKTALAIFLRKICLYNFCVRHKSFFRRIYHFQQRINTPATKITDTTNIKISPRNDPPLVVSSINTPKIEAPIERINTPTTKITDTTNIKISPHNDPPLVASSINSPRIEALIEGRSLEGDMTSQSLIYLYELGSNMRHILCVHPSSNNIQALYMLSKAGTKVTCLACNQHETELQKYGFTTSQANLAECMITTGHTTLCDFDGLLLDAQVEEATLLLLKGRLWPKTKILINGATSVNNSIRAVWGTPHHTINGLDIYEGPSEAWLDPIRKNQTFYYQTDWPWKHGCIEIPPTMLSGRPWPKISIVTVTLNQGSYLEETLRSVLIQGYPNLEYIVIDGGSNDNTPNILDRYRNELDYCISEKDKGQSDALNKGFQLATGEILAWLNSDDIYLPGALFRVALAFDNYASDMVAGGCALRKGDNPKPFSIHHNAMPIGKVVILPLERLLDVDDSWQKGEFFYQPEVFFSRDIWERSGAQVDEKLYYSMDYELWLRLAKSSAKIVHIPDTLTAFRLHEKQKTNFEELPFLPELYKVSAEFKSTLNKNYEKK